MRLPSWVTASAVLFLGGCAAFLSPAENARELARTAGLVPLELPHSRLLVYGRAAGASGGHDRVTVYIESDGAPWPALNEPPADPTPVKPLVLRMAISDPMPAVTYLGRPCQYLKTEELLACDPELWTLGRYREQAVIAMSSAIDAIKRQYSASTINLVGYSGGGSMAALIASRRNDVACLVTIAAPLDTLAWTDSMGFSPLNRSLNPADEAAKLVGVRQVHFRGVRDKLVPPASARKFLESVAGAKVIDKANYDHDCCWADHWRELWGQTCLAS